jgi:23S rRNA (uridine2552-2'-O)-methyltransferase
MSRRFLEERRRDPYYRTAQKEGLRSRASFKLAYLADRYPILPIGGRVLDLGAAPGGWSLVAAERVGRRGQVVSVDLRPIEPAAGLTIVRGRVGDPGLRSRLGDAPFDAVLADLSPHISGAYATDHARSIELAGAAFDLAETCLDEGGAFVAKVFDGDLRATLEARIAPHFARFYRTKPPASRARSSEIYLVGIGFRPPSRPPDAPRP